MADYKEKFDEWQQAARGKARELDEKYAISDMVGEGARVAGEAAAAQVAQDDGAEVPRLRGDPDDGDGTGRQQGIEVAHTHGSGLPRRPARRLACTVRELGPWQFAPDQASGQPGALDCGLEADQSLKPAGSYG